MPDERYTGHYPEDLFTWQRVLYVAAGRELLTGREVAIAGFIALSGDGTSGQNCRLDEKRITAECGIHRATLHRTFTKLRNAGWFVQTRKPTYTGAAGRKRGRMALYRLSFPDLDLAVDSTTSRVAPTAEDVRHDLTESRVADVSVDVRFDSPVDNEVVSHAGQSRVANQAESCRTVTPGVATLPTFDTPTFDTPTCGGASSPASTTGQAREPDHPHPFVADWYDDTVCRCGLTRATHGAEEPPTRTRQPVARARPKTRVQEHLDLVRQLAAAEVADGFEERNRSFLDASSGISVSETHDPTRSQAAGQ